MHRHQNEKRPELSRESQTEHRQSANQLAEPEKLFGRKIAVSELIAEKHPDDRRNWESVENPNLLMGRKPQTGQISEDQWKPRAPNDIFENHHQEELPLHGFVHQRIMPRHFCGASKSAVPCFS